ncbi:MAG: hypothetical protein HYZ27_12300, partial [Deltaproteobacteria bacterium]|nr:hypothetical protein [Deltaproteobacteria bacterium]
IRARAYEAIRELGGDLRADPNWDAYKLLPRASRLHRFLIRPMTLDRWGLASAKEIDEFSKRSRFLLDELEGSGMTVERAPFEPADTRPGAEPAWVSAVRVTVDGHSAKLLGGIKMRRACAAEVAVFADANLDGALGPVDVELVRSTQSQVELDRYNVLTPRPVLMAHPDPSEKRGRVRVGTEPTSFVYFVVSRECVPEEITLEVADLVTGGSRLHVAHVSGTLGPTEHLDEVPVTSVPQVLVGGRSPHPWAFEQPESPRRVILGPGSVDVPESRDYSDRVTVEIRPGTTLRLGPKVSLRFRGPLLAEGSRDQPIVIEKAADAPFGGVSLEGPGTEGSRLSWVRMEGGTKVEAPDVELTALFNAHDTSDLRISDSTFLSAGPAEDVVHLYKVSKLSFHEVSLSAAPVDALDLEFVEGELRGLSVQGAGDDCVDLMGSRLTLSDSVLVACVNNGVSAGEETDLFANGLAVVGAKTGILAKNASTVRLIRSLVFDTKQALRTRAHEVRYGGTSRIGATEVFVLRAEAAADVDGSGSIELSGVEVGAPEGPDLRHIITDVLELEDGRDLTTSLLELEQKVRP